MKLARYGRAGKEKPALVDGNGKLRDLSEVVTDIDADVLSPRSSGPSWPSSSRNPCPRCAARPGSAHASRKSAISSPWGSITPTTRPNRHAGPQRAGAVHQGPFCVIGPNDDVMIPKGSTKTDWEVELAIVIGTRASYVSESQAPPMSRASASATTCRSASFSWNVRVSG